MNLGAWRVVIVVALVVVGAAVLANGFGEGPAAALPTDSPGQTQSPSPTGAPTPPSSPETTPEPNTSGIVVKVFNGTAVTGLAGIVQQELVNEGQVAPEEPADAPAKPAPKTIVYFRGGAEADQNRADATYLAETYLEPVLGKTPRVDELSAVYEDLVGRRIAVVVLLGEDYARAAETG
ncbi:MAG: hypothetical protein KatS3mg013_1740 [Actinomycetota bacterium]|nr:MAG: hypothetical protein KatS3mg013_1740 [Actinomycetota bacterium]